jgi:uncharacterized membrane protein
MSYWPLAGIAVVIIGFAARLNALLVIVAAGAVTGFAAGMGPRELLAAIGSGFLANRYLAMFLLTLPVLGALERHGLREHAAAWVARRRELGLARLLVIYLGLRQLTAALGLISLAGQAQTVRPLLAPMAESAAQNELGALDIEQRERVRAMAAATDNVGLFFGEDIFVAFGAVLLIRGVLAEHGVELEPLAIALWGIPTAVCAFAVHALRLRRFGARLRTEGRSDTA